MLVRQSYTFWHYTGHYLADNKNLASALVPPYGLVFLQDEPTFLGTRLAGLTGINTLQQVSATCSLHCNDAYHTFPAGSWAQMHSELVDWKATCSNRRQGSMRACPQALTCS